MPATSEPATSPPETAAPSVGVPEWRSLGDVAGPSPRSDHTWTLSEDGTAAYLFGGRTADGASNELWQFDLAANAWSQIQTAGEVPDARWGHTGTWVPGQGLVIWSGQSQRGFFGDIWRFEPASRSWQQLPSTGALPEARYGSCASLGPDGRLWISHGFTEDEGRFADTRAYDFSTGEWTDMTPSGRVPVERCLHDCFWSAGSQLVLYGGQTTGVPALGDVWAYDLATGDWTASADGAAPARNLYALSPAGAGAIVFGGESDGSFFLDDAWFLDEGSLAMSPIDVPTGPVGRAGATLITAPDGRTLLFGGQGEDGQLGDLWELGGL